MVGRECSEEEDKRKTSFSVIFLFFNWELLKVRALWPHVGGNSGRTVGGRGGGGGQRCVSDARHRTGASRAGTGSVSPRLLGTKTSEIR